MDIRTRRLTVCVRVPARCEIICAGEVFARDFQAAAGAGSAPGQIVAGHAVKEGSRDEDYQQQQND